MEFVQFIFGLINKYHACDDEVANLCNIIDLD